MNPSQWNEVLSTAREDVPTILDDLKDTLDRAARESLEEGGTGKVKVGLSLTIDYSTAPPSYTFEGAISCRTKVAGPVHQPDQGPELMKGMGKSRKGGRTPENIAAAERALARLQEDDV